MEDYISEFEYVSSQVNRLPEEQYLGYFLGGLKPENLQSHDTASGDEGGA